MPAGLATVLEQEELRPLDIVIAVLAKDLGDKSPVAISAAVEREACIEVLEKQIGGIVGDRSPDDLDESEAWAYGLLDSVKTEIENRRPVKDEMVDSAEITDEKKES